MPKINLTRTRRLRLPLGGGVMAEVRSLKTASFFWIRPAAPGLPPITGELSQGSSQNESNSVSHSDD